MPFASYSKADNHQSVSNIDYSPILGAWENLSDSSGHVHSLTLRAEEQGFSLDAIISVGDEALSSGTVSARVYVNNGTEHPMGFHTRFNIAQTVVRLVGYATQGICVVQTYSAHEQGSHGRFTKEFFRKKKVR